MFPPKKMHGKNLRLTSLLADPQWLLVVLLALLLHLVHFYSSCKLCKIRAFEKLEEEDTTFPPAAVQALVSTPTP
jgi:hypothetical protein